MNFSGQPLFRMDLKFTPGNCYVSSAPTARANPRSLRILSGDLDPTTGNVSLKPGVRMSVLQAGPFRIRQFTVLDRYHE